MSISVVTYNIQYGFGLDEQYDLERIVNAIAAADIICLQEVTRGFIKNGGADMPALISDLLPDRFWSYHPAADIDMMSGMAGERAVNRRFQFGNMVLSRWPIRATRYHLLPRLWRRDELNLQRGALEATIDTPVGDIRFYSTHFDHIDPRERLSQASALADIALNFAVTGGAVTGAGSFGLPAYEDSGNFLLLGDFNFAPASDEYAHLTQECGLVAVSAADTGWSWRDPAGRNPDQRLDHIFANPALASRMSDARVDRDAMGSDHMPVWATISA